MPPSVAAHCTPARRCHVRPNRPPTSLRCVPHQNVYAEEATASAAAWGPLASLPRAAPSTQRDLSPVRKAMNSANIGAGIAGRCQLLTWPVGALYIVLNDKLSVAVDGKAEEIIEPRAIRPALEALPPHTTHHTPLSPGATCIAFNGAMSLAHSNFVADRYAYYLVHRCADYVTHVVPMAKDVPGSDYSYLVVSHQHRCGCKLKMLQN